MTNSESRGRSHRRGNIWDGSSKIRVLPGLKVWRFHPSFTLSHSNLGAASTSYSWSHQSQFLIAESKVSFHLIASVNFSGNLLFLWLPKYFSLFILSFLHWFPFLNPSLRYSHPPNLWVFFLILPSSWRLVILHDPIIFTEMILKSSSLAWTSFLKLRAIFSNFFQQIQPIIMEALLGWVLAT